MCVQISRFDHPESSVQRFRKNKVSQKGKRILFKADTWENKDICSILVTASNFYDARQVS